MKSIFETEAKNELINRLNKLTDKNEAKWGKMNAGQMVWHCQGPLDIMLQNKSFGMKSSWIAKLLFKKSLYNDKPWRKNLPTSKFLKTKENKDVNSEKIILLKLIDEVYNQRDKESWHPHPAFGYFTPAQWGQMQYKHLDHHLKQFGID